MTGLVVKLCGSQRNAVATVLVWFILIVLLVEFAPSISDVTTNEQEDFLSVGVESVEALALQRAKYPAMDGISAIAVFHSPDGLSVAELRGVRLFSEFLASHGAPDSIANVLSVFDSPCSTGFTPVGCSGSHVSGATLRYLVSSLARRNAT